MRSIPVNLNMKMTQSKTDELPLVYCWPGDHYLECQWWCLSGESCPLNIRELLGCHLSTKSFIAKHYFFLIILMIENNQTLVPNKNAANFFGVKCVVPSLNPVARLLVSPGAYKPCWEWVDRCDRPGDFLGAGQCSYRIRGSVHHDLLTISLVFSLFPGMKFYGLRIWEVFVMVGNWDLIFSSFWTALDFGGSLQKLWKNLPTVR